MKPTLLQCSFLFLALSGSVAARADVAPAGAFGDHMVLQRDIPLPLWGKSDPGEAVTVTVAGKSATATADAQGRWRVQLPPLAASSAPLEVTITGKNRVVLSDVLVGDVWICSGQSNMEYSLGKDSDAREELAKANDPAIRLCRIANHATARPETDRKVNWTASSPETAKGFSAVGYYLGKDLHEELGVPVGLMSVAVSGTPAQLWTGLETLKSDPAFAPYLQVYEKLSAQAATRPARGGDANAAIPGLPGSLYNGMIAPLAGLGIKGFAWYQGESNTDDAAIYRKLFPAMITEWRKTWADAGGQAQLPFVFVQLPGNGRWSEQESSSKWARLREAQAETLQLPRTGMAVTIDLSLPRQILHPKNKREVGRRLAQAALRAAYGEKIEPTPSFDSFHIEGGAVRITFKNVEGGLVAGALQPRDPAQPKADAQQAVKGFLVAGADHQFVPAEAVVDGKAVVVSSPKVAAPVAVRYAWADNPEVNLYDRGSRPVAPFRTDSWEN
jgi:sialate O-acetylesterase